MLDTGCWILVTLLDARFLMIEMGTGYWILDAGYWIIDNWIPTGCQILAIG